MRVKLIGEDGNAFSIVNRVITEMKKNKASEEVIDSFRKEALSGDYEHLLRTCMKYVEVV